ncbi:MAG TPA: alpha/beta fold hydrolase [Anaerolineae bacterium]|nr:alpha/beta fold hydrolase [Anaerolineae bacterium]
MKVFQGERHADFLIERGQAAALLIHGFPGTPAEMRPIASFLNETGWTTRGLLLPGFGAQIDSLFQRHPQEWIDAAVEALQALKAKHQPIVLIGYSLGAAISIHAAAQLKPDQLILLAPFWQLGTRGQRAIFRLIRPIVRHLRPFSRANFNNPRLRRFLGEFLQDADLDDPDVQQLIRQTKIPVDLFEQIHRMGQQAYHLAKQIDRPTLILQGRRDPVVTLLLTQQLMRQFAGSIKYVEIDAPHQLIDPTLPDWPQLARAVREFIT